MYKILAVVGMQALLLPFCGQTSPGDTDPADPGTPPVGGEGGGGGAPDTTPVHVSGLFSDHMVLQRGITVPLWGTAGPGQGITVTLADEAGVKARATARADTQGQWRAELPPLEAGGPYTLSMQGYDTLTFSDVMVGEVWLASGQSNMARRVDRQSPASVVEADIASTAGLTDVRILTVSRFPSDTPAPGIGGRWQIPDTTNAGKLAALPYHFGRALNEALDVPVGVINATWSGTQISAWMGPDSLAALAEAEGQPTSTIEQRWALTLAQDESRALCDAYMPEFLGWRTNTALVAMDRGEPFDDPPEAPLCEAHPSYPSALYLGMLSPLVPYGMKGVIWWQGEGNSDWPNEYALAFPLLIEEWRRAWGQGDFPFLFVQLGGTSYGRAALRQAQLATLATPGTGMAVSVDVPTVDGTHAATFEGVGRRLALWARARAYGEEALTYSGPLYRSMSVEGDVVRVSFDHAEGGLRLASVTPPHKGFQVAGADGRFVDATRVEIDDTTTPPSLVVASAGVPSPVDVRYLWGGNDSTPYSSASLYNGDDLPASPFHSRPPTGPAEAAAPLEP